MSVDLVSEKWIRQGWRTEGDYAINKSKKREASTFQKRRVIKTKWQVFRDVLVKFYLLMEGGRLFGRESKQALDLSWASPWGVCLHSVWFLLSLQGFYVASAVGKPQKPHLKHENREVLVPTRQVYKHKETSTQILPFFSLERQC